VWGDRFEEFWNLVFMEFDQQPDGSRPLLPNPTVDTGLGFDRIVAIVQGDRTGYGTDHFAPIVNDFKSRAAADAAIRRSSGPSMCSPTTSVAPGS